jgi:hypothetical protein
VLPSRFSLACLAALVLAPAAGHGQETLRWNLAAGDELAIEITQHTTADVSYAGKRTTTQIDLSLELRWKVLSREANQTRIQQSVARVTARLDSPAGGAQYDSSAAGRPQGRARELASALAPLAGATMELVLSDRGEMLELRPQGEAAEQLLNQSAPSDGGQTDAAVRQVLRQPLVLLPVEAAAEGATWTESHTLASALGPAEQRSTYRYAGTTDESGQKFARLEWTAELTLKQPPAGVALKEHAHSGTALFDVAAGRLVRAEQTQKLTTERPFRDTTIVVTLASRQTTTVRPAGK